MMRIIRGSTRVDKGKGIPRTLRVTDLAAKYNVSDEYDEYVRLDILNKHWNVMATICCRKDVLKQTVDELEV